MNSETLQGNHPMSIRRFTRPALTRTVAASLCLVMTTLACGLHKANTAY